MGSARLDAPGTKDVVGAQRQVRVAGAAVLGQKVAEEGLSVGRACKDQGSGMAPGWTGELWSSGPGT